MSTATMILSRLRFAILCSHRPAESDSSGAAISEDRIVRCVTLLPPNERSSAKSPAHRSSGQQRYSIWSSIIEYDLT
jgi:hypothetical protein